jgi:hypothetical protein
MGFDGNFENAVMCRGSSLCGSGCEVLPGGRGMVRVFVGGVGSSGGGD